jgi:hypothetical protein
VLQSILRIVVGVSLAVPVCCHLSYANPLKLGFRVVSYQGQPAHILTMDSDLLLAVHIAVEAVQRQKDSHLKLESVGISVEADFVRVVVGVANRTTNREKKDEIVPTGGGYVVALSKTDLKVLWVKKGL